MPFIIRDETGQIAGVFNQPVEGGEEVDEADEELQTFVHETAPHVVIDDQWVQSDLGLSRVIEDLIDILIERNVINFTDFPDGAQKKLLERRGFRKEFAYVASLFGGDEDDSDSGSGSGSEFL